MKSLFKKSSEEAVMDTEKVLVEDEVKKNIDTESFVNELMKKRKKKIIIVTTIIIVILLIGIFSVIFSLLNINNKNMISGVSISNIDISGLSIEEAKAKINAIYQEKKEKEVNIKYEEYENSLNPTLLEVNYNIEKAIDDAYLIGRADNILINNYNILFSLIFKKNIVVDMNLNEEIAKKSIEDIGMNLPGIVIDSNYSIEEDKLIITKGKEGIYVDVDTLLDEVKKNLGNINANQDYIYIPVINKKPEEINIDKMYEEIHTEPKDAYYTKEPFTIYPEVEGVDFNLEAAKELLKEDKDEYIIQLVITKPKITISQIGSEAFQDQLAIFTTRYDASVVDRSTNLKIACQKINGKVVLAGETFSYNKALGVRTAAAGYKNAKIYEAGEVVDGIGGGICQISSTLYNAILMANLETVERRNHQFVTSYVPAGRDATVVYGLTDFQFKNTRQYPIRISASVQNGIATVAIYGIKEENEYTFTFNTKTIASIPFATKYIEDASLEAGTEKVKQKGANGLKTETYIIKSLNGKIISTKLLSKDTYDAMTRIIIKSTKTQENISTPIKNQETTNNKTPIDTNTTNTVKNTSNETTNTNTDGQNTEVQNNTIAP